MPYPLSNTKLLSADRFTVSSDIQRFGEKLHLLRVHHNLTLVQLALLLGYQTHSYISEIESGHKTPTVGLVLKVSRLFSVTTDELLIDEIEIDFNKSHLITNSPENG